MKKNSFRPDYCRMAQLLERIANPGKIYRPSPFWAWNGMLTEERLREEIRAMHDAGLGGFFMHGRSGLETEYLGDEWFRMVRACADEAKALDMEAWLYDEDRWPSGVAGGKAVTRPEYAQKGLAFVETATPDFSPLKHADAAASATVNGACETDVDYSRDDGMVAAFAVRYDEQGVPQSYRPFGEADTLENGERFLRFNMRTAIPSRINNGTPYIDTMNPEAVREFIRVTHERYAETMPELLGADKPIPGIFTDEPTYHFFDTPLFWTPGLPDAFKRRNGYELIPRLPELILCLRGKQESKLRLDYMNTVTELFTTAFGKQIGDWCEAHDMAFTGHILGEENIFSQWLCVGAAMRFYAHMQIPGMDDLTDHWNTYDSPIQVASVARQFGRARRLSEMYALIGWQMTLEQQKAVGDWQAALGITLRCPHLTWYTMAGIAKRDCPGSFSPIAPWFGVYRVIEDYYARICSALSGGEEVRDVLVVHPIESLWFHKPYIDYPKESYINYGAYFMVNSDEKFNEIHRASLIRNALLAHHIGFDYGDEAIMADRCSVDETAAGPRLRVGEASYKAVVIPALRTIRATTLDTLRQFAERGGHVFYVGDAPSYRDGELSDDVRAVYEKHFQPVRLRELTNALAPLCREFSLSLPDGIEAPTLLYNHHRGEDHEAVFVCNTSTPYCDHENEPPPVSKRTIAYEHVTVTWSNLPASYRVYELDLQRGAYMEMPVVRDEATGDVVFPTSFPRLQSRLFIATAAEVPTVPRPRPVHPVEDRHVTAPMPYSLSEDNILVLDHFEYAVDGGAWQPNGYVLAIDDAIHRHCGVLLRRFNGFQPWYRRLHPETASAAGSCRVALRATFDCLTPPTRLALGLEQPWLWDITLNGVSIEKKDIGEWCEPSIRTLQLPVDLLHNGINTVEFYGRMDMVTDGLEAMYLIGNFGVDGADRLVALPNTLAIGDVVPQGLRYYAGNLDYHITVTGRKGYRCSIRLPEFEACAVEFLVNGRSVHVAAWPPYEADLTPYLTPGEDADVVVRLYGSRRNAMGPFYSAKSDSCGFYSEESPVKRLVPFGLLLPPYIAWDSKN